MRINGKLTKSTMLHIRIPVAEHAKLKEIAAERNTTVSRLMQPAIRGMATKRGAFLDEVAGRLGDLTSQVLAVGRNLNQIARAVNRNSNPVTVDGALFETILENQKALRAFFITLKKEEEGRWVDVSDVPAIKNEPDVVTKREV